MRMIELSESGMPWIIYKYNRPDWLAMLIGGRVICQCCICGIITPVGIKRWDVWFPPRTGMHPLRAKFCKDHQHPGENKNRTLWAYPLKNI